MLRVQARPAQLSEREAALLTAAHRFRQRERRAPTYRELGPLAGRPRGSVATIACDRRKLEARGFVHSSDFGGDDPFRPNYARLIPVTERGQTTWLERES